jgi:hypothetical protein
VLAHAPSRTVALDLYREWNYVTTLPSAETDGNGKARYEIVTQPDDPAGSYCVVPRPFRNHCARFTVT